MKRGKIFTLAVAFVLTAGVALATQTKTNTSKQAPASVKTTAASVMHHETGTIASLTSNQLTLDHTWKGKQEQTKFTLDSATKKEGNVAKGDHVVVYYHLENGQRQRQGLALLRGATAIPN